MAIKKGCYGYQKRDIVIKKDLHVASSLFYYLVLKKTLLIKLLKLQEKKRKKDFILAYNNWVTYNKLLNLLKYNK